MPTHAQQQIRTFALAQVALVKRGEKCSCHAMAEVWAFATRFYMGTLNNDEETYVEDVAYILAGVTEWATRSDNTQVGKGVFTDSGFKAEFRDGSNQVQHFAAGVMAGFQYGRSAWLSHGVLRPDSPQDSALNDESTWLGANLNGIGTSLSEVKQYIITNICEKACGVCP